jgi:3-oxoacyl-[acyl-carrier-protein] synthase III
LGSAILFAITHKSQNRPDRSVTPSSAAFYLDNDPGVLISACLFGDGAGAAVLAAEPAPVGRTGGGDDRQPCWQHAGLRVNKAAGTLAMFSKRSFRAWSRPMRRTLDGAEHRPWVEPSG